MIKRTVYLENGSYLSIKNSQLKISVKESETEYSVPCEDIGFVLLDTPQIVLTASVLSRLMEHKAAVLVCDKRHMPDGLLLPMEGHSLHAEILKFQIKASDALKNNFWKQVITSKIKNQALHLREIDKKSVKLNEFARKVKSGDPDNYEARAARYYWQKIFDDFFAFKRDAEGDEPNNLLNYGYAVLRAVIARSLVLSGLHPALGIFHRNRYNPFALADDIMEPYRPVVDNIVFQIVKNGEYFYELTPSIKKQLLSIPAVYVSIEERKRPLMVAAQQTAASLARCFKGEQRKIIFPEFKYVLQQV